MPPVTSALKDLTTLFISTGLFALALPAGLIFLISRISGWHTLARNYAPVCEIPRPDIWMGSGVFRGWIGYNGGIIVASGRAGLYLRAMPILLSWCHSPIFIPWNQITEIREERRFGGIRYRLTLQRTPGVNFALRAGTFDAIRKNARLAGVPGNY